MGPILTREFLWFLSVIFMFAERCEMLRFLIFVLLINITCNVELGKNLDKDDGSLYKALIGAEPLGQKKEIKESEKTAASDGPDSAKLELNFPTSNVNNKNYANEHTLSSTENINNTLKTSELNNDTSSSHSNKSEIVIRIRKPPTVDSDALLRGLYVFIGLSIVTLSYVMYRSYRLRNGSSGLTTVRKYGILTQRTDMEMLPLPLDDDEDDDTVFDVGNHTYR